MARNIEETLHSTVRTHARHSLAVSCAVGPRKKSSESNESLRRAGAQLQPIDSSKLCAPICKRDQKHKTGVLGADARELNETASRRAFGSKPADTTRGAISSDSLPSSTLRQHESGAGGLSAKEAASAAVGTSRAVVLCSLPAAHGRQASRAARVWQRGMLQWR